MTLKPGDKVNCYWFTPRKPKDKVVESIFWDDREVWVDSVDKNEEVEEYPYQQVHSLEGPLVKLKGKFGLRSVKKLELCQQ